MNTLTGLILRGFSLNTEDNYNSTPGLKLWLDGRERVTKNAQGEVSLWGDRSAVGNNVFQNKANQKPNNSSGLWIDSAPTVVPSMGLNSNRFDYKFLHNGSPFGMYSLVKVNMSTINSGGVINTRTSNTNGFSFILNSVNSGRIVVSVYCNGVLVRQQLMLNIALTYPSEGVAIVRQVFKGINITNNQMIGFNNLTSTSTHTATNYTNNNSDNFLVASNSIIGQSFKTGITLLYDWTGFTPTQVTAFDTKVMALLNLDKAVFEQLG